jgi:hypothetical protein
VRRDCRRRAHHGKNLGRDALGHAEEAVSPSSIGSTTAREGRITLAVGENLRLQDSRDLATVKQRRKKEKCPRRSRRRLCWRPSKQIGSQPSRSCLERICASMANHLTATGHRGAEDVAS